MIISDLSIKNRISVMVFSLMILIFGVAVYNAMPRESEPDITIPNVFVSTSYKGVSSTDIETTITIPIENKLKGLDRVKKVHSVSSEGLSSINIEFLPDTDIDEVLQKVRDKVDEAKKELPTDLEEDPSVFEVNFSEMPIVVFSLNGTCGDRCLKEIAEEMEEEIESIPGILEVDVTGTVEREILIEVDPEKLAFYRIPITLFSQVIGGENQNTSGGAITLGSGRYQLRVPGEFATPEEIYGLVVTTHQGQPVYLKDVAKVVDGFKEEESRSRLDGVKAVNLSVKKRAGENIISITDRIDEIIAERSPAWPPGTTITKMMDKAKDIRQMVADLENNILSGLVLVIGVLFFFLGFRNALLVGLAIPFSMLLSFIVLDTLGITLNMVVLFSLTLALGMLVDNAIVIVENIYRYMEQGVPKVEAAMKGTSEVAWPVIGSVLTTLAAFSPMLFWPGIMGEFMGFLPLTLIVTLASSLLVALVINPALAAYFMKLKEGSGPDHTLSAEEIAEKGERPVEISGRLLETYDATLRWCLQHRLALLISSFLSLIILIQVWLLVVGLEKPVEFFPNIDPKNVYVNIDPPEGADLDYIDNILRKVEMAVAGAGSQEAELSVADYAEAMQPQEHHTVHRTFQGSGDLDNIEYIYAKAVRSGGGASLFASNSPNHIGIQFVELADRLRPTSADVEELRKRVHSIAGAEIRVAEQQEGPPTGAPVNIEISGDDFDTLGVIAKQIKQIIARVPFVEEIEDDYVEGIPSVQIRIDRQKAALFGLTTGSIGFALKSAYNGMTASTYHEGGDDFDITVKFTEQDRQSRDVLEQLMIPAPNGSLVPLTSLATIEYSGSRGDIVRINNRRVVTVKADVDETKVPGAVALMQAQELLKEFHLPPGYRLDYTGQNQEQEESEKFLSEAFVIAIFLIFLILVTLFNSVTQPLIIMTSVILSLGGAFLGLSVIGSPFGVIMSGVGVISLAGVVVNNAIVLIDYTNKLVERGVAHSEAIIAAGATRLRPVILTAITTVLGLIPMVTGVSWDFHLMEISWVSESTQWWRSMAIVVIFGLGIATFLTLVVVPTLYSVLLDSRYATQRLVKSVVRAYWRPIEKRFPELKRDEE